MSRIPRSFHCFDFATITSVMLVILFPLFSGCGGGGGSDRQAAQPSTAAATTATGGSVLDKWRENMVTYGHIECDPTRIQENGTWEGGVWYYDGIRAFLQIAKYTGDSSWVDCAREVRKTYRDYVLSNGGRIPGWRVFSLGLAMDYLQYGEGDSREGVIELAQSSAFANSAGGPSFELTRETAYLIHAYIDAADVGVSTGTQLDTAVSYALGHLDQWRSASYVKPFMIGLSAEALIRYYERTGDARIPPAIEREMDWLWDRAWNPSIQAFSYLLCDSADAEPECSVDHSNEGADLSLLIAPAYAWLYSLNKADRHRDHADAAFAGGVNSGFLANGKQFSQNYRWSFDFVRWRYGEGA